MTPEFKSVMQQAAAGQSLSSKDISRFTPTDIRTPPQVIVRNERLAVGLMCLSFKAKRVGQAEELRQD